MDKVNFGATKIGTVKILKLKGEKYVPYRAHFIKLETENDFYVLKAMRDNWGNSLMGPVCDDLEEYGQDLWNDFSIFALSERQRYRKNAKIDPDKILGATLFVEYPGCKDNCISVLQTKPEYISHDRISDYKHIGQGIVRSIQKKFHTKAIIVDSEEDAVDFYIKQGFVQNKASNNPYQLIWEPRKSAFGRFFINLFHNFVK
ncbi:hypothetical protein J6S88_05675 [bacterium]|nr:hypothetical protein [bacterium]